MRKLYLILTLAILLPSMLRAESIAKKVIFIATGDSAVIDLRNTGIYNHSLTWTGSGTRTSCSIKVSKSITGTSGWTDLITAQACTTDGSATITGYANYVKLTMSTLTGAGNTVNARYDGTPVAASLGTITSISTIADGASVTLGAKADAKNSASDTTPITLMQVMKQLSYEVQALNTRDTTGATPYSFISTASANLTNVKASAGIVYSITVINPGATLQYLRLYNKATAPDPSACSGNSDCPVAYYPIPANGDSLGAGFSIPLGTYGMAFSTGIGYSISGAACTVVSTCTDETNSAAGVSLNLTYK